MAAMRGQRNQDQRRCNATQQHCLFRPDRAAGVKVRRPTAELASREPIN